MMVNSFHVSIDHFRFIVFHFFFFLYACVYSACMCLWCMHVFVCMSLYMCGGWRMMVEVFLNNSPSYFWKVCLFFNDVLVCVCVWIWACEFRCPWRPEASDPLELELQTLVSCLLWVLGIELRSSARSMLACCSSLSYLQLPSQYLKILHWPWSSCVWGWLTSSFRDLVSVHCQCWGYRHTPLRPAFMWVLGNLNSDPCACTVGTWTAKPPPQPLGYLFVVELTLNG